MSKISTYNLADAPLQLSDRLIGTEAPRPIPSATPLATKNFSLGELLLLFSSNFPAASLEEVLITGNTATNDINLTGTINTTLIKPGNIIDMLNSQGTPLQILSKGVGGICWIDGPNLSGYVPTSRELTINGVTYDLSANRSWNVPSGVWGSITGVLTSQIDLINYLDANYYPLSSNPAGYLTQESVLEFADFSSFPPTGASNTIYIALDTNIGYYWNGSAYIVLTSTTSGITGFGTTNYVAKFTPNGSAIGNSKIYEDPSGIVGINYSSRPLISGNTTLTIQRTQTQVDFVLGNPSLGQSSYIVSDNELAGFEIQSKGEFAIKTGFTYSNEALRAYSTGQLKLTQVPATGTTSDFVLLRDSLGNLKQIAYPTGSVSSLTTTGSSGASTLIAGVLNIPTYTLSGLGGQPLSTNLTSLSGLTYVSTSFVKMTAAGTFALDTNTYLTSAVTSVAALTLGTTGTDLSSTVANGTTTPVITLNVPTASATNRGALSSTDWSTFNNKQNDLGYTPPRAWKSAIDGVTVSNTTTITPTYTQLIPANTFSAGDVIELLFRSTSPNARVAQSNIYIYVNTTANLSGTPIQIGLFNTTPTGRTVQLERALSVKGSTTRVTNPAGPNATDTTQSAAMSSLSINWAIDQYFVFAIGNTVASPTETMFGDFYRIIKD